jgi:DnaJ-class molecular chaperone
MNPGKRNTELTKPADFYKVLGVARTATLAEIKLKFRAAAWDLHPDRNGNAPQAAKQMAELNEAYSTLKDVKRRKAYDAQLALFRETCPQCKGQGAISRGRGFNAHVAPCGVCNARGWVS